LACSPASSPVLKQPLPKIRPSLLPFHPLQNAA
jgi:hypothetical protein